MNDLKITYKNENGEVIKREYYTIIDFIDEMKSDEIDIPMMDYIDVEAEFFEKNVKKFETIEELLNHCKAITR